MMRCYQVRDYVYFMKYVPAIQAHVLEDVDDDGSEMIAAKYGLVHVTRLCTTSIGMQVR
jgi:hypothetical protein